MLLVIFLAIGIHEYCHAKFADMAGDPTPGMYGRVTLNLFNHFDPLGSIFILITVFTGFGFGWGRPVPMDPSKMRNPKLDHFVAVAAGPLSNLLQAAIFATLLRGLGTIGVLSGDSFLAVFFLYGVLINLGLFVFNLIPIGPLDGMWLFGMALPDPTRLAWTRWNLSFGAFLFIPLVLIPIGGNTIFGWVVGPAVRILSGILLG